VHSDNLKMEKARKFVSVIRNNWKKSVFFTIVGGYGAKRYNKKLQDDSYMAELSREALTYGSGIIHGTNTPLYRVTVILNPVASGGNGRKYYEKYCAPLLNLAGMKVSVIRTERDGQAKDIMEIMADADAVLVAGGDGTLMEAVTGLLRRPDHLEAAKIPIGVLPVGRTNSLAHRLFGQDDDVKLMGEATMSVVRQLKKRQNVIEAENKSDNENHRGKKVYAVNNVEMGAWTDARKRSNKYWLFGFGLKNYITYIGSYITGQSEVGWNCELNVSYAARNKSEISEINVIQETQNNGWLPWIFGKRKEKSNPSYSEQSSNVSWINMGFFDGTQIVIENQDRSLGALFYECPLEFSSFVTHGWSLWRQRFSSHLANSDLQSLQHSVISIDQILIEPKLAQNEDANEDLNKKKLIYMDGDEIELLGPLLLRHLKDKIIVFCEKSEAISESSTSQSTPASYSRWTSNVKSNFMINKGI